MYRAALCIHVRLCRLKTRNARTESSRSRYIRGDYMISSPRESRVPAGKVSSETYRSSPFFHFFLEKKEERDRSCISIPRLIALVLWRKGFVDFVICQRLPAHCEYIATDSSTTSSQFWRIFLYRMMDTRTLRWVGFFARNKRVLYFTEVDSDQFLTRRSRVWGGSWTRMKFLS